MVQTQGRRAGSLAGLWCYYRESSRLGYLPLLAKFVQFPALTEALTIEKSEESAQSEADELAELIQGIAHALAA